MAQVVLPQAQSLPAVKVAFFMLGAAATTLGLFWLMSLLINSSNIRPGDPGEIPIINITFQEPDNKIIEKQTLPPPEKVVPPPKMIPDMQEPDDSVMDSFTDQFAIDPPSVETGIDNTMSMNTAGDARPIVRIEPRYPIQAARDGIEGWVRLSFTINSHGGVEDVTVIDSEPRRVFDREATRALRKWKYKPRMEDGKAVAQTGLTVELAFNLNQEQ